MGEYRKYLEPEYGEVSPEVEILKPQVMDMEHVSEWRARDILESVAAMNTAMKKCNCYDKLMEARAEEVYAKLAGRTVRIKIYIPAGAGESLPVLMFYHGGSFSMNSVEVYEYVHRYLCAYGNIVVAAPDYHLAPEYKFPQGLNEAYDALVWAKEHIGSYHGNPENISVAGDSSGGNFAAAAAIMARDRRGPGLKKQILFYPLTTNYESEMTDSEKRYPKGYFLEYNCMEDPMDVYFEEGADRKDPLASPLLCGNLSGLPDACFLSAECDPLLDQGLMYAAKLEDHGVKVEYHIMKGMVHGFLNCTYGKTFEAMNLAIRFIKD